MKVGLHHQRHQSQVVLGQTVWVNPWAVGGVELVLVVPLGECTSERVTEVAVPFHIPFGRLSKFFSASISATSSI